MDLNNCDVYIDYKKNQTWESIVKKACSVLVDPSEYSSVGFEHHGKNTILKLSGENVLTRNVCLHNIEICEPSIAGTFLSYFQKLKTT